MSRRWIWVSGVAVGLSAVAAGVALAPASGAATTLTFRLAPINLPNGGFVNVTAPAGPSSGDVFLVAETYLNSSGQAVGYDRGTCTLVRVVSQTNGEANCVVTAAIPGGQVTFQGIQKFSNNFVEGAITGGTGRYAGRDGTARVSLAPDGTATSVTITLP